MADNDDGKKEIMDESKGIVETSEVGRTNDQKSSSPLSTITSPTSIEDVVEQLWLEKPGMGMKEMLLNFETRFQHISSSLQHPAQLKKRIKAAKAMLPFRRISNLPDAPSSVFEKESFVQNLLEQRTNYRFQKQYAKSDRITRGLTAMGIHIDDGYKTWAVGPVPTPSKDQGEASHHDSNQNDILTDLQAETNNPKINKPVPCGMCGKLFKSRNLVFKHLRDPASGCGTSIFSEGQSLPDAPSQIKKETLKVERKKSSSSKVNFRTGGTAKHAHKQCCLWIGDLPLPWTRHGGKYKRLRALLFAHIPKDVPMPWIKTVVRKAYRARSRNSSDQKTDSNTNNVDGVIEQNTIKQKEESCSPPCTLSVLDNDGDGSSTSSQQKQSTAVPSSPKQHTEYLGYAIVVFRDADEANAVRTHLDGTTVSPQTVYRPHQLLESDQDGKNVSQSTATTTTNDDSITTNSTTKNNTSHGNNNNTNKDAASELIGLPSFALKVRAVENSDTSSVQLPEHWKDEYNTMESLPSELDPPLMEQLRPLPAYELQRRATKLLTGMGVMMPTTSSNDDNDGDKELDTLQVNKTEVETTQGKNVRAVEEHEKALELAVSVYWKKLQHTGDGLQSTQLPLATTPLSKAIIKRQEIYLKGDPVEQVYLDKLLRILQSLRWPAQNERQGLSAERYLVLPTNIRGADPHYGELRDACTDLMMNHPSVPKDYYYSGIAVTKNFVASPHIDVLDQTYQFAISLGNFTTGGELCIESGMDGDIIHVVETKNRLAKVDGRHVHWVRTWNGGDRYSLIFYDTSDRNPTPVMME